jgi:phenylacetate-CoA ligase
MRRYLSRNALPYTELQQFCGLDPRQQRLDLAKRLLAQIKYFGARGDALPEWREAARINDPEALWHVWPSLPVMTKRMLQTRFPAEQVGSRFGVPGLVSSTGGSTGEPTHFYHDTVMLLATQAAMYYTREKMGWRPGMPVVIVWGSERDIGKQMTWKNRVNGRLRNEHLIDAYELTGKTVDRVLDIVRREKPLAIYGFTSMLQYVAETLLERNIVLPPGTIAAAWNGGEMLYPEQAEVFHRAFGSPLLNCYGGRELGTMACQFRSGGPLNVIRPWVFGEVVDDDGRPAQPGTPGRLLWTSTVCRGTPFLRYEIEDLGSYARGGHDESGVVQLSELHGRSSGLLELPDGRKINNIYWNHLFKEIPGVKQFQVVLRANGSVRILLCGAEIPPDAERHLRTVLGNFLRDIPVDIERVDHIPLTKQGKRVHVLREQAV